MSEQATVTPIFWTEAEPERLARDLAEIRAVAPDMKFERPTGAAAIEHHGIWTGRLPTWPLGRPKPDGLDVIVPRGLECVVRCSAAHPMIPPQVYPTDPEPLLLERSQHKWHVAPAGSLCLMQSTGDWEPEDSIADLLLKAAAWRVEYELMKTGHVTTMSLNGIVSDDRLDHFVGEAANDLAHGALGPRTLEAGAAGVDRL